MCEILKKLVNNPSFKDTVVVVNRKIKPHQIILHQGETHPSFYLIKSGAVRILIHSESQDNFNVHPGILDLGPDDVFGELELFGELPAHADVIAITKTELIEIDKYTFLKYLQKDREKGYQIILELLQALILRLRDADKKILYLYRWGLKCHDIDKFLE